MNTKLNWKDVETVSRIEKQFLSTNLCMSLAQELDLISLRSPYRLTDTYPKTLENIVHSSRLDYGNALCCGLPKYLINRLQLVQNSAARFATLSRKQ